MHGLHVELLGQAADGRGIDVRDDDRRPGLQQVPSQPASPLPDALDGHALALQRRIAPRLAGGGGDPSPITAYGVYLAMLACAEEAWNEHSLEGRRVAVQGVGKVGFPLVKTLVEQGKAHVTVSDVDVDAVARAVGELGVETASSEEIHTLECDIFAPCALGSVINEATIRELRCRVVAGSANNQLASPEMGKELEELGILYAPDYVVNAGGLINVADELYGYRKARARASIENIYRTLREVFTIAREEHIPTSDAADRFAETRIDRVGRLRLTWVPGGRGWAKYWGNGS